MAKESTSDLCVDDFYFSVLFNEKEDDDKIFPVSDAKYAEELQYQEAIMASLISSSNANIVVSPPTIQEIPAISNPEPMELVIAGEFGESSQSFCEICVERKESHEMFRLDRCSHSFCSDCITKHVAVKIQEKINVVTCPGLDCKGVLELDTCKSMIPKDVIDRWDEALCDSLIPPAHKFYCPFKDCSAMLVNDDTVEVIRECECPICHRLFCAQCYVPWHPGIGCEEFQALNEDERGREDLMVRELAREKNWMRCPYCKFIVEKTQGCLHMTCRCSNQFCYACGAEWTPDHGGCQPPPP